MGPLSIFFKKNSLELMLYGVWPQAHWALAQTFSRTKTKPKPHGESISFWMHYRQTHVEPIMTCSGVHLLRTTHVLNSSVLP